MNNLTVLDFDYDLPKELIAKYPLQKRDSSRMLVMNRKTNEIFHKHFFDFIEYLNKDDILVLNNTKVIPARFIGKKTTGAKIEIFLTRPIENNLWMALIKNSKRIKSGDIITINECFQILIKEKKEGDGVQEHIVEILYKKTDYNKDDLENAINKYGKIPLPPYIQREATEEDKKTYQTVFAKVSGSVAAPTAGLHFTKEILEKIEKRGVKIVYVTLNVGLGTFLPVKTEKIEEHKMHTEKFYIPKETAEAINNKKGSVVCVGTTTLRCLEATFKKYNKIVEGEDETDIFIYPPYEFKVADKLLTNFHLPKSTLIMLISAFYNKESVLRAYDIAIKEKYRFFSYGDCTFIM